MKKFLLMEGFDLFFFLIIFMVIGILVAPYFFPQLKKTFNCAQFDNKFMACVNAQQEGRGCSWYAACNKCIVEGADVNTICGS